MQFLRPRQVLDMIGVTRTTLWRMFQAGLFPRPVHITERNRGYLREAVEAWMTARAEETVPFETGSARPLTSTAGKARHAARGAVRRLEQRPAG